jgi:hypothetical protein
MATQEQKDASAKVMQAVTALNTALLNAGMSRLHVELRDVRREDMIVPQYQVSVIETPETVLP